METYTIILSLITIVGGVLQIILFFKLWIMTNNIKKIETNVRKMNIRETFKTTHSLERETLPDWSVGSHVIHRETGERLIIIKKSEAYNNFELADDAGFSSCFAPKDKLIPWNTYYETTIKCE